MDKDRYLSNAIVRAVAVLEAFSEKTSYSNAELSKKLSVNKSTMLRILYTLEQTGLIQRDPESSRYHLTYKIHQIGRANLHQSPLHQAAFDLINDLSKKVREAAHLGVLENHKVLYLIRADGDHPIGLKSYVGIRYPAFCTAIGKVLLAYLDDSELEVYLKFAKFKPYTPNTIRTPEKLIENLRQVRKDQLSIVRAEYGPDVMALAAPVFEKDGRVMAAVSVAGPLFRMDREEVLPNMITSVKDTARKVSSALGWFQP